MGYSYCARTGRLDCDGCGAATGTTRKRTCPYRVEYAEGGSLPYCQPAALCSTCYIKHKPTLHARCKDGAAEANRRELTRAARLTAGDYERRTAWGDWHETVPAGLIGLRFVNRAGHEEYRLVDAGRDRANWLSEYGDAQPWEHHA